MTIKRVRRPASAIVGPGADSAALPPSGWDDYFVSPRRGSQAELTTAVAAAIASLESTGGQLARNGISPAEIRSLIQEIDVCPERGSSAPAVLAQLGPTVWENGVFPTHPSCAAHLHSPTLVAAVATELAIGATNQSMDSWDQAPAATELELHLMSWLCQRFGLPPSASGVMTAGGTSSNLLGLTLARATAAAKSGWDIQARGLPPIANRWRFLCSDQAHFSVQRAAALLGLGRDAAVTVATDESGAMAVRELALSLDRMQSDGEVPIAIVATAGTTDLGAVDPIGAIAHCAAEADCWLHVDAAVGGAFALSDRLRPLLGGIERADSVTVDFHKLWWQPISASALVVRDAAAFDLIKVHSPYLDRGDDLEGTINLVGRSLDTSRRFDAAKVVVSLRTLGRHAMAQMLEHVVDLAQLASQEVQDNNSLELIAEPTTIMCVFGQQAQPNFRLAEDEALRRVQQRLLERGEAVIGRTMVHDRAALKLTFVNPTTTTDDVRSLVRTVARELERVQRDAD